MEVQDMVMLSGIVAELMLACMLSNWSKGNPWGATSSLILASLLADLALLADFSLRTFSAAILISASSMVLT